MKSLHTLIRTGGFTQRERVLLLKHDAVKRELEGRNVLQAGVFNPNTTSWSHKSALEMKEYNSYIDVSNFHLEVKMQVNFISKNVEIASLEVLRVLDSLLFSDFDTSEMILNKIGTTVDVDRALELVVENSGLEYEDVVSGLSLECEPTNLKEWMEARYRASMLLRTLIDAGELETENKVRIVNGEQKSHRFITGNSLYKSQSQYSFVKEYRKQIDYFKRLGFIVLFLQGRKVISGHIMLLSFRKLFEKLSSIFDIDLTYTLENEITKSSKNIQDINQEMSLIYEKIKDDFFEQEDIVFPVKILGERLLLDEKKFEPDETLPTVKVYTDYLKKFFLK